MVGTSDGVTTTTPGPKGLPDGVTVPCTEENGAWVLRLLLRWELVVNLCLHPLMKSCVEGLNARVDGVAIF